MPRNWVLSAFIITLVQDVTYSASGRITLHHTGFLGMLDSKNRLLLGTIFKLSDRELAVRKHV